MSSYLNSKATKPTDPAYPAEHRDGRWVGDSQDILVEVKQTHNMRDVRDALLRLAYKLDDEPMSTEAVCVVARSKMSELRLRTELDHARKVLREPIAKRLRLHAMDARGVFTPPLKMPDPAFSAWLSNLIAADYGSVPTRRTNRQTVVSALAMAWLRGEGPQTSKALQEACGASYPTVASAVDDMSQQGLLVDRSDRKLLFQDDLPVSTWTRLGEAHAGLRTTTRFVDPSGQARGPEALANRLFGLQRKGLHQQVAVGGVLGAMHYFPDLDITASPRLDLSVYGASDLAFVRQLDAALVPIGDPRARAALVVHMTPEPERFIEHTDDGAGPQSWASELECFADLLELGFKAEAADMVVAFNRRRVNEASKKPVRPVAFETTGVR